jgi:LacI family transcriptional regulator
MVAQEERVPSFRFMQYPIKERAEHFRRWLHEYRPEAILTDTMETLGFLEVSGVRVPQDIGLAVTSVLDGGADSGLDQHGEEIGRTAFLMLNSQINEGARGIPKVLRQLLVEGDWVDGASLPRKPSF